eukprot:scaffold5008_cov69-Phaeocystis_antarctica.AAC.1
MVTIASSNSRRATSGRVVQVQSRASSSGVWPVFGHVPQPVAQVILRVTVSRFLNALSSISREVGLYSTTIVLRLESLKPYFSI